MTSPTPGHTPGVPNGPPFDVEVLAALHAGAYPAEIAASLHARASADPDARAVLAALDATVADLHRMPPIPMPRGVADRLDAVIAAEAAGRRGSATRHPPSQRDAPHLPHQAGQPPNIGALPPSPPASLPASLPPPQRSAPAGPSPRSAPMPPPQRSQQSSEEPGSHERPSGPTVTSLDAARAARAERRQGGRRERRWATGLGIAAAAAAVFTVGTIVLNPASDPGHGIAGAPVATSATTAAPMPSAGPGAAQPAPGNGPGGPAPATSLTQQAVVATPHHLDELLPKITGSAPVGPLSDPARLHACLEANGQADEQVLGVLPVQYTGEQAFAISLRDPDGTVHILVVRPGCGASGADLLEEQTTG